MENLRILVTGGAGFLGSHFVRHTLRAGASNITNIDALTYAGDQRRLAEFDSDPRYIFVQEDVADGEAMRQVVAEEAPDVIVHYAAESHVTRSEKQADLFYRTNVEGTRSMLEAAVANDVERFIHISTDEVYGPVLEGYLPESAKPTGTGLSTSPYAQSKAIADDLALSYSNKLQIAVARPTNAFGPWQFPEKAFPRWITRALRGEPLLVWGDGLYIRQWLFAEDFATAIALLVTDAEPGHVYNVGPVHTPEITNIDLVRWLVKYLDLPEDVIEFTAYDRPDHDRRYAVDPAAIQTLGWQPGDVWSQLAATVDWYKANRSWWQSHVEEAESIYADHKA
ncbi:MAG: dTDP-glucose 4,6-dehydratase [Actinomycetota bacterium]|nr:NAD-dependent epimerase/dehydratase family protein [Actinomycetota bacterium]